MRVEAEPVVLYALLSQFGIRLLHEEGLEEVDLIFEFEFLVSDYLVIDSEVQAVGQLLLELEHRDGHVLAQHDFVGDAVDGQQLDDKLDGPLAHLQGDALEIRVVSSLFGVAARVVGGNFSYRHAIVEHVLIEVQHLLLDGVLLELLHLVLQAEQGNRLLEPAQGKLVPAF